MATIHILLIDDSPTTLMEDEGKRHFYPSLEYGYNSPDGKRDIVVDSFSLGWLQSPRDVAEFRYFTDKLVQKNGLGSLTEVGFIPEIILFDYRLSEKLDKFIDEDIDALKEIIPTYKMASSLNEKAHRFYDWDTEEEYKKIEKSLTNSKTASKDAKIKLKKNWRELQRPKEPALFTNLKDDMGCYSGGIIALQFKDHPCIGIPFTSKEGEMDVSDDALFFEWLLDKDFGGQFGSKYGRRPYWNVAIPQAVRLLRDRITNLVAMGKISLSLSQLINFVDKKLPLTKKDRVFTFESVYGTRHLPLDGLFIDVSDRTDKDEVILAWIKLQLKDFKTDAYKTAKEASTGLIKAYQAWPIIKNRLRLSELTVKLCNNEVLTEEEENELSNLKTEFGIGKYQMDNWIANGETEKSNITGKVIEYRDVKTDNNETNRLIILFTDLQLHKVWQNFCEMNKNSDLDNQIISQLKSRPTLDDLRASLFPVPRNPLVLPYHYHLLTDKERFNKRDPFEIWDTHLGKNKMSNWAIFPKSDYPNNIGDGEKQLCSSFALDIGLRREYYPVWLLKQKPR